MVIFRAVMLLMSISKVYGKWLSLHSGRIACLINEPFLHTNIAIVPNTRLQANSGQQLHLLSQSSILRSNSNVQQAHYTASRQQADSIGSGLPTYEPLPPSIGESALPDYWEIAQQTPYGRSYARQSAAFTQSMPMLLQSSDSLAQPAEHTQRSAAAVASRLRMSANRFRLSARTNPDYHYLGTVGLLDAYICT
ncbi:hypothetical protein BX667DRAFT_502073, partial [Coemansia mojavensis]